MKSTLIDAGPIIALFNKNDTYHKKIKDFMKEYKGILLSTWPVVTEVSHMLDFSVQTQIDFLTWVNIGGIILEDIDNKDISRISELSRKYSDVPMDVADASLVVLSEKKNIKEIITIDSDYYIYRTVKKEMIKNIFHYTVL
ncbi:type II toxin-antitoxin system VapC family toxin [Sediminispirochaeta smaragdinae]|uniref:PIN domain protein n=1 Tax=Sediminispirochaeta smaragdinae (strain DSM 11293 / JCM 15392 / SEBR 4228) TaxID=573413 RepID=E1RBV6_SEDSS|nr:PIN domain-containing protein [Sediminispirochaeta smaragdinae]ADK79836.1 PIN domain protein [Sediminispirochaeta smaragdinae DSM 11293]